MRFSLPDKFDNLAISEQPISTLTNQKKKGGAKMM